MLWLSFTKVHDNGFDHYDSPCTYHNYIAAVGWYARHIPLACYSVTHLSGGYALFTPREWHYKFNAPYTYSIKNGQYKTIIYCAIKFNLPYYTYFKTVEGVCLAIMQYLQTINSVSYQATENIRICAQAEQWDAIQYINHECDAMIDNINKYRRMMRSTIENKCVPIITTAQKHTSQLRRASHEYIHSNALTFFDQAEKTADEERDKRLRQLQNMQWESIRSRKQTSK
jgi:hypothetical protein